MRDSYKQNPIYKRERALEAALRAANLNAYVHVYNLDTRVVDPPPPFLVVRFAAFGGLHVTMDVPKDAEAWQALEASLIPFLRSLP